jgi:hypothetical protein
MLFHSEYIDLDLCGRGETCHDKFSPLFDDVGIVPHDYT